MAADHLVVALQGTPLLTIPKMRAQLDAKPSAQGIHAWWLVNANALPAACRRRVKTDPGVLGDPGTSSAPPPGSVQQAVD